VSEEFISEIEFPFTQIPIKIWELNLQPTEFLVLTRIIYRAGLRGQCFESRNSMSKHCNISIRSISSAFSVLEELNIIEIKSRKAEMKPNLIRIKPVAQWLSRMQQQNEKEIPSATIALPLVQPLQEASATIAHGTRSNELDQNKIDLINIVAAAQPTAPSEPMTELVTLEVDTVKPKSKTELTWRAYCDAYQIRYKVEPLRNAKVNAQLKQFCERVGYEDAPELMRFYLGINDFWYVKQMHTVGIALADAEKIVAAYRRGSVVTKREAEYIDKTSSRKSFIEQIYDARDLKE
jgi:SOS-response transcriptional repressor LexA